MNKLLTVGAFIAIALVSGCKDDDVEVSSASCTMVELQSKAAEVAEALQQNPSMAQELMAQMQEIAPQMQAALSDGTPDEAMLGELCGVYDEMLENLN